MTVPTKENRMDHQSIRDQIGSIVSQHIPTNCHRFKFHIFDGVPQENSLGFRADPKPFDGQVIATTVDALFIKVSRADFAVVDRSLVTLVPEIGAKVSVTPYWRRDFNGERLDKLKQEMHTDVDGTRYSVTRIMLGGERLLLPLPALQCQYLCDMREQIETLRVSDGFRTLANLLVDSRASDFQIVDPSPTNILKSPPEISCAVQTNKFVGRFALIYDRPMDLYIIKLRDGPNVVCRKEDIDTFSLPEIIEDLIDDGQWRFIKIELVKPAKSVRETA